MRFVAHQRLEQQLGHLIKNQRSAVYLLAMIGFSRAAGRQNSHPRRRGPHQRRAFCRTGTSTQRKQRLSFTGFSPLGAPIPATEVLLRRAGS